jgi:phosphoribosylformylglycinamidine synthase
MHSAVIVFPGSNCDRDAKTVLEATGLRPVMVWHGEAALPRVDLVVLPGGFSYGDYLRSGGVAAHSPIMREVRAHAERGGLTLGICNGFQVLCEAGLLPGALLRNRGLRFICKTVHLRVENARTPFTRLYAEGQVIAVPIAHHDGNYVADAETLARLEDHGQVAFRYCDAEGTPSPEANPNGSARNIAGVLNVSKNVLGMMPHPERHAEMLLGGVDGRALFEGLLAA